MVNTDDFKPSNSKINNVIKVIHFLHLNGASTASDISQGASIPLATTYRIVHILLEEQFILQSEKATTINGRQPTIFSVNPNYSYAVSIILQKTSCNIYLSNLGSQIVQSDELEFKSKWEKDSFLINIDQIIEKYLLYIGDSPNLQRKLCTIHIAVEADVDISAGRILHFSGADCFDDFDIVSYYQTRYHVPAYLNKLSYVEALAAIRSYCRYDFENYVYMHIGVGFGATIVIDRKIYTGVNGKAGELAHLRTNDGRSWEEAYGTSSLYQRLIQAAADNPQSQLNSIMMQYLAPSHDGSNHSFMSVLEYALEADCREAIDIVSEAAIGWAKAISLLYAFYDPEVVVIGGDISGDLPHIFNLLRKKLVEDVHFSGIVLPAQYEAPLINAVIENTIDPMYDSICNEFIFPSVQRGDSK